MPSYSSIYKTLRSLADQEARVTRHVGRDLSIWGSMRVDNVQQWIRMQDLQIGRESRMLIGVAATYFEIDPDLFVPGAADLDNKLARIAENKRSHVTVETFLKLINHEHFEMVGTLHWLRTLVSFVPELAEHKSYVSLLFRTRAAKHRIPACPTKVHPLVYESG